MPTFWLHNTYYGNVRSMGSWTAKYSVVFSPNVNVGPL